MEPNPPPPPPPPVPPSQHSVAGQAPPPPPGEKPLAAPLDAPGSAPTISDPTAGKSALMTKMLVGAAVAALVVVGLVVLLSRDDSDGGGSSASCPGGRTITVGSQVRDNVQGDAEARFCLTVSGSSQLYLDMAVRGEQDTTLTLLRGVEEVGFSDDVDGFDPKISMPLEPGSYVLVVRNWATSSTSPNGFVLSVTPY